MNMQVNKKEAWLSDNIYMIWERREVYHTKRMQHVICVKWSSDNKYVMSGSDEMNIRLWKANAAEKLGVVSPDSSVPSLLFPDMPPPG